jgi:hypothetical protein
VVARELGQVLEPRLPGGAEAVDEDDRRALAHVDVVGLAAVQPDPVLVARPVDVEPLSAADPAVVVVRARMQQAAQGLDGVRSGHGLLP